MSEDIKWIAGVGISVTLGIVGMVVASFRNLAGKISGGNRDLHKRVDDVKDKYARRDDMDAHLTRIDNNVQEIRTEMRENHRQVLAAVSQKD